MEEILFYLLCVFTLFWNAGFVVSVCVCVWRVCVRARIYVCVCVCNF